MNLSLLYNFFTGETSPLVEGRVDSQAQQMGAKRMENFIPMPTGGLRKRPGTVYDREIGTGENRYYIPIETIKGNKYLIVIISDNTNDTSNYVYIYKKINKKYELIYQTNITLASNDFTYCYEKNNVWIFCQGEVLNCYKLEWDEVTLNVENITGFIGCYLVPKTACFYAGRLCLGGGIIKIDITETYKYTKNIYLYLTYNFNRGWINIKNLLESYSPPPIHNTIVTNINVPSNPKMKVTYTLVNGDANTFARITTSKDHNYINPDLRIHLNDSNRTVEKEYDIRRSYPEYYEEFYFESITRMISSIPPVFAPDTDNNFKRPEYAGVYLINGGEEVRIDIEITADIEVKREEIKVANNRNRIALSKAPDSITGEDRYTNFELGSNPADAIAIEENDMYGSQIQWVFPHRRLLVATEKALWSDTGDIPTPTTFDLNIIDYRGGNSIRPVVLNDHVLYVSRDGNKIYSVVWVNTDQYGGYQVTDISENATHLFYGGIKSLATSNYPYTMLWVVTNKGELVCGVFNGGGYFFTRCNMPYVVDSVIVMNEEEGDVLCIVTKEGNTYNLEHLTLEDLVHDEWEDSHYVDSGEILEFEEPTQTITGLERFEGKEVSIFADGSIHPTLTVENGQIELQYEASKVHIGLSIKSKYSPNTQLLPANGTSMGKKRRIDKVTLKLFKSLGGKAGVTEDKANVLLTSRFGGYKLGEAPDPFTGEIDVTVSGNIDTAGQLEIVHEDPTPFTLLALTQQVAVLEA